MPRQHSATYRNSTRTQRGRVVKTRSMNAKNRMLDCGRVYPSPRCLRKHGCKGSSYACLRCTCPSYLTRRLIRNTKLRSIPSTMTRIITPKEFHTHDWTHETHNLCDGRVVVDYRSVACTNTVATMIAHQYGDVSSMESTNVPGISILHFVPSVSNGPGCCRIKWSSPKQ